MKILNRVCGTFGFWHFANPGTTGAITGEKHPHNPAKLPFAVGSEDADD